MEEGERQEERERGDWKDLVKLEETFRVWGKGLRDATAIGAEDLEEKALGFGERIADEDAMEAIVDRLCSSRFGVENLWRGWAKWVGWEWISRVLRFERVKCELSG